jgi:hypothetical protein
MHDALALKMTRVTGLLWGLVHSELIAVRFFILNGCSSFSGGLYHNKGSAREPGKPY